MKISKSYHDIASYKGELHGHVFNSNQFLGVTVQHTTVAVSFGKAREKLLTVVTANTVLCLEDHMAALWLLYGYMADTAAVQDSATPT